MFHKLTISVIFLLLTFFHLTNQECAPDKDCHPPLRNFMASGEVTVSSTCSDAPLKPYWKNPGTANFDNDLYCNGTGNLHQKKDMYDRKDDKILDLTIDNPLLNTYWQSKNTLQVKRDDYLIFKCKKNSFKQFSFPKKLNSNYPL